MGLIRKPWFFIPALLALALGLYAAAGFWLAPKLVRSQATAFVHDELGKSLGLGEIRTHPFKLTLEVSDIAIADADGGKPLLAADRLFVDLEASSLWQRSWNFREVSLVGPYADARIGPDGALNLAELIPESEPTDEPLPMLWLQALSVAGGRIDFADHSRTLEPSKTLAPIDFTLSHFRTTPEGGGFRLSTASAEGERLDWNGQLSLEPLKSDGHFEVGGLLATSVYAFFSDELPLQLSAGRFDLTGDYRFEAVPGQGLRLEVSLPRIDAGELALRAKGVDSDWVTLTSARVADTRLAWPARQVDVASAQVQGLKASLWREADGHLNLERLLAPAAAAAAPTTLPATTAATTTGTGAQGATAEPSTTTVSSAAPAADDTWRFELGELRLEQGEVDFEDRTIAPAARFRLAPLALTAQPISLDMSRPVGIQLQATVNQAAPLRVSGEVVPDTVTATLQVEIDTLPIAQVRGYLPALPSLQLRSGSTGARGELSLQPQSESGPWLRFSGGATVSDFDLIEARNKRRFLSWQRLDVDGLEFSAGPDTLKVRTVQATRPYARVVIAEDRSINLATMFGEDGGSSAPASSGGSMPIRIGRLQLAQGTMSFADFSIDPNFQAEIQALRGSVTGLSTAADSRARIDLQGHVVNRFSPVRITGETNIAAWDRHTDVEMAFENIELPIFNPYSGRWAGYAISKGKLSTELHYRIDDRALVADHHVVINQLEWGGATDSEDKVSLPIRLATALLKDRNGVIDLELPVSGTLDDPEFRIGPVVWQIIKNLIVKVVTAPFAFLGSLFEGAEDARYVDFAPGSAELPTDAAGALAALAKGLNDRPALNLDIPAGAAGAADAQALREQRFMAALAQANGNTAEGSAFDYAGMEPGDRLDLLEDLYRQSTGEKPEPPEVAKEDLAEQSWSERRASRREADIAWLEGELRPRYAVAENELLQLGQARAVAIQAALLADGNLDPTRVFLASSLQAAEHEGRMRVELQLK